MPAGVDVASSPQVFGAIFAAAIAAVIGILNVGVTIWQGHLTRKATGNRENRDQWWSRFVWAIERIEVNPEAENLSAELVLHALVTVAWVDPDDKDMAEAYLEEFNADITEADIKEAEIGQDN